MRSGLRHSRRSVALASVVVAAAAIVLALAGCGSGGSSTTKTSLVKKHQPKTLDIYASLPLNGPQAAQANSVLDGISLALTQAKDKAGPYGLHLYTLDDSGPHASGWTKSATLANARHAATNPDAILYIGELDSAASAFSIPILNQARIPQISPGSPADYLTGDSKADAASFRPTGLATFLQLVPDDGLAAVANLSALSKLGCTHTLVVGDNSGTGLIKAMLGNASSYHVHLAILGKTAIAPTSSADINAYVDTARQRGDCVFYAGVARPAALTLTRSLRQALPATAAVVGSSQLCDASWARAVGPPASTTTDASKIGGAPAGETTATTPPGPARKPAGAETERPPTATASAVKPGPPADGQQAATPTTATGAAATSPTGASTTAAVTTATGTTATDTTATDTTGTGTTPTQTTTTGAAGTSTGSGLWCTSPTPDLSASAPGRAFVAAYRKGFHGRQPDLPAIFGYEAMQFGIEAIKTLGAGADNRSALLNELHTMSVPSSALGPFTFGDTGYSTLAHYSLYRVQPGGTLSYDASLPTSLQTSKAP